MNNINPIGDAIIYDVNNKPIYAKTQGQKKLIEVIDKYDILFVNGPAGCGKTFLSICKAVSAMDEGRYKRLVLTRPAVESGEELGHLPGDLMDKIAPYMRPLYQSIEKLKKRIEFKSDEKLVDSSKKKKKKSIKTLDETTKPIQDFYKKVEVSPLAYMRGLDFENSFIIIDEAQNTTMGQMKLFLTRLGMGSKAIITGDVSQTDLKGQNTGFSHAQKLLQDVKGIGSITLGIDDIVRHRLVKDIILKYESENK